METMSDNSYPICENCIFVNESIDNDPCRECIMAFLAQRIKPNFVSKYKPVTNGDRIRAMTDEELAKYLFERGNCTEYCYGICAYQNECNKFNDEEVCIKHIVEWLRKETDE